jgi:polar amino acid transport system substrate-binding protein
MHANLCSARGGTDLYKYLIVLLLLATVCPSQANGQELVMVGDDNAPFFYSVNDQAVGLYPTIVKALFRRIKQPVVIKAMSWKRALTALDAGEGAVAGIYKNRERLAKYDYTDQLYAEHIMIFVRKGDAFEFKGISSLAGKKVGVIRGWSYGDEFDQARKDAVLEAQGTKSDDQNLKKLARGRLDAVLALRESAELVLQTYRLSAQVVALPKPYLINPTYIALFQKGFKTKTDPTDQPGPGGHEKRRHFA